MKLAPLVVALFAVVLFAVVVAGCAPEPQSPPPALTKAVDPPVLPGPLPGRAPRTTEVEDVRPYKMYATEPVRVCFGPDPFFAFDASKPSLADQPTMKNLIACMRTGPLQGKMIKLVGHTDPRGTLDYNERLGLARAEKVKKFLVSNGIDADRVLTATMGAEDAAKAPEEWAADRRVDIELVSP